MICDKNSGYTDSEPSSIIAEYKEKYLFDIIKLYSGYYVMALPTKNPTRDGAEFLEWNYEADGTGTKVAIPEETNASPAGIKIEDTTTVYAIWGATVSFDLNYTDAPTDWAEKQEVSLRFGKIGKSLTENQIPIPPEQTGYTFDGWYPNADGTGDKLTTNTVMDKDTTWYAKWTKDAEEEKEQLWYYEIYYHSFDADTREWSWVRYNMTQGGWGYPDETVAISHEDFDDEGLGWDAIDGSGTETLGVHYIFDDDNPDNRLSALVSEATKDNPLKIYYDTVSWKIKYEYTGNLIPDGADAELPTETESQYSLIEEVEEAPGIPGYTFSGWTTDDVAEECWLDKENEGEFYMPNQDVTFTGSWTANTDTKYKVEHYKVSADGMSAVLVDTENLTGTTGATVTAAAKTYTGYTYQPDFDENGMKTVASGEIAGDGSLVLKLFYTPNLLQPMALSLTAYEGGSGSEANPDDALPDPVWRYEAGDWTLYFDGKEQPEDTEPFQWGYFLEGTDTEQTSAAARGVYELRVWALEDNPEVTAETEDGQSYVLDISDTPTAVQDEDGNTVTVSVRDITDDTGAETLSEDLFKEVYGAAGTTRAARMAGAAKAAACDGSCDTGEPHAHVAAGTTFEKNGIHGLAVNADADIALLYDGFLPDVLGSSSRMDTLHEKAVVAAGGAFATEENVSRDFRYMDLVDTKDGNLWVATADESDVTVFLPYTKDMTQESDIAVVYFDGLTRDYTIDMDSANLDAEIGKTQAHKQAVTKTAEGITFQVPYKEFGPFEIMWLNEDEGGAVTPGTDKPDTDIPDTEAPDIPAGADHDSEEKAPQTGVDESIFGWAVATIAGAAALGGAVIYRRKAKKK